MALGVVYVQLARGWKCDDMGYGTESKTCINLHLWFAKIYMTRFNIITIAMARSYPRGIYVTDEKLILATKQGGALAPSPPLSSYKSHHHHRSKVIKTVIVIISITGESDK